MNCDPPVARGLSLYPVHPPGEMRRLAHAAEDAGYRHLWFGDSQNIWREAYVTMAAAAVGTSRITIGTGVTNGVTRHRSVIASAWASLHELTGGRVAAGFGVGDSALHTMGARPMKVAELDALIGDLRRLWRGDEIREPDVDTAYRLAYLDRRLDIPVYLAASGPRLLELAGRIADGVILLVGTDPVAVQGALDTVAKGAASGGRSLQDIDVVLWAPTAIAANPEVARDQVRPHVARTVLRPIAVELTEAERAAVERVRERYDYYAHMVPGSPHSQLVTTELVDRFALAGTREDCRTRLRALARAGIGEVAMVPFTRPGQEVAAIEDFASL